jgi:hypothetical protein
LDGAISTSRPEFFTGQIDAVEKKSRPAAKAQSSQRFTAARVAVFAVVSNGTNFSPFGANSGESGGKFGVSRRKSASSKGEQSVAAW